VANNKINGRVSRLLVTPLLRALKKTLGDVEYIDYMDSFRYPLAGEFSFRRDVLTDLRIPSDWGLEIGVLSEMYRNYSNNRLCQVDIADATITSTSTCRADDASAGLSRMSIDICKALFRKLATRGVVISSESFRSLKASYYRIALDFVETYHNDAVMNGLDYDVHGEEHAVELFAENIMKAGEAFLDRPMERPFIPSWSRVAAPSRTSSNAWSRPSRQIRQSTQRMDAERHSSLTTGPRYRRRRCCSASAATRLGVRRWQS
jgi:glucosyl-3-phosphoglycerate synthase